MGASALVIVLAALVVLNVVDNRNNPPLWIDPIIAAALLGFARLHGLTWAQLGLGRSSLVPGVLWGSAAIGTVALVYVVGVALPATRGAFRDERYHLSLRGALRAAFVTIPIGTILVEDTAFRSVLWALLREHVTQLQTLVVTSALFGLWHILPARHFRGGADKSVPPVLVLGTVAFTALGGVVAGILRIASDSVLASAGMHWATNALGVLFGVVAWRLAPAPT